MDRPAHIVDADDPRLAPFRDLQTHEGASERVIVEGAIAVGRLLESGRDVEAILATPSHARRLGPRLETRPRVPLLVAEAAIVREVAGFDFHRGCLASTGRPVPEASGAEFWADALRGRSRLTILVAVGLADPANLGAIIRTARAFAVDLVLCDRAGADPYSRRAIRAAMGNVFCLPVMECTEPRDWIETLRRGLGARVVAASPSPAARQLGSLRWPDRAILLVGNEGDGLAPDVLADAELEVSIPIDPAADSLNVASATAILLHHAYTVQNPA